MRKWAFLTIGLLALGLMGAAVSSNEYKLMYWQYSRSDGLYQRLDNNGFDLHINGFRMNSISKAVYEDFTEYGDEDVIQVSGTAADIPGGGGLQPD